MNLAAWNRFDLAGFAVSKHLMGLSHRFVFETVSIEVQLPAAPSSADDPDREYVKPMGWYGSAKNDPESYYVKQLSVWTSDGSSVDIDLAVLNRQPNAEDLIPSSVQAQLEQTAQRLSALAGRAFAYWLSVMRWTTDNFQIGHLDTATHESGWSPYLVDIDTRHRVWVGTGHLSLGLATAVTQAQWSDAARRLEAAEEPPVYVAFKHDARGLLENGEYRRCMVELAICCETFLRSRVLESLPALPPDISKHVEDANINQFLSRFFPALLR